MFVGENFRELVCEDRFSGDAPLALGHRATHRHFPMLLGCGYAVNSAAMRLVMPRINALAYTTRRERDTAAIECISFPTASEDAAFSKCLLVAGVALPFVRDLRMGGEYFIPHALGTGRKMQHDASAANVVAWYWKGKNFSAWPSPRHKQHCCAQRMVLAHSYKGGQAQKVLGRLYLLEAARREQQPQRASLDVDLVLQAELAIWGKFDFLQSDERYAASVHVSPGAPAQAMPTVSGLARRRRLLAAPALAPVPSAAAAAQPTSPTPPAQSAYQRAYVAAAVKRAAAASNSARPAVLAYLDSAAFRASITRCCGSIAHEDATQLLARLEGILRVAELTHNFHSAASAATNDDVNVTIAANLSWWPNQWALQSLDLLSYRMTNRSHDYLIMETAEVGVFGAAPFSTRGEPPTRRALLRETLDRPVYAALNAFALDAGGSPGFGGASVVFNRTALGGAVVIAAADSGVLEFSCNASVAINFSFPVNCSSWDAASLPLGTLDSLLHLLLPNNGFWRAAIAKEGVPAGGLVAGPEPISMLFARHFATHESDKMLPEIVHVTYLESNLFATPHTARGADGVKMVIGVFSAMWGNANGTALRRWCEERGWLLVWALGDGPGSNGTLAVHSTARSLVSGAQSGRLSREENRTVGYNHRVVDPSVAAATRSRHNASTR